MLVPVIRHYDCISAHILCKRLQVEGIPAIVFDSHYAMIDWSHINAIGGVRVMVPSDQLEKSLQILQQIDSGHYILGSDRGDQVAEPLMACPRCQSLNSSPMIEGRRLILYSLFTGLILFPVALFKALVSGLSGSMFSGNSIADYIFTITILLSLLVLFFPKPYANTVCNDCNWTWHKKYRKPYGAGDMLSISMQFILLLIFVALVFYLVNLRFIKISMYY